MNALCKFCLIAFLVVSILCVAVPKNDTLMTFIYIRTGEFLFYFGGLDKAEGLYLKAIDRLQQREISSSRLVQDLRHLAWQRSYIDSELEKGIFVIRNAILVSEKNSDEMAELYKELGEALNYIGRYEESEKALIASIELHRILNNRAKQFDVALKMAISYAERSAWEKAEQQLVQAVDFRNVRDSQGSPSNSTLTEVCLLMGKLVLHIVKDKTKAFEYHLKAWEYARKSSLSQRVHVQIALGSYYESSDQFEEAIIKYRNALDLCAGTEMDEEEDYIKHTMRGCLRKFSMNPSEGD